MSELEKELVPAKFQLPIDVDKYILQDTPAAGEQVPFDVVFVGGGPAGLAGAIELARLVKKAKESGDTSIGEVNIGVLEKAEALGNHSLSGAVINPMAFKELFPEMKTEDFPFKEPVKAESVYLLTENKNFKLPTPPTMKNHGNYVASLSEAVRWLGAQAEGLGINILTNFPVDSLVIRNGAVSGVMTTPAGLDRSGQPGPNYLPPTEITAKVTVLCEGTRGPLTQAYQKWQSISSTSPQIYALGVKELWKIKKPLDRVIHTMGWPLPRDAFGGSFFYPMGEGMAALGLVVGLDYHAHNLDIHGLLQKMKGHPFFREYLADGEIVEWGAKTIPEGGFFALPKRYHGEGILFCGDTVGLVNVPALKGIHYAMLSGIYAARTIFDGLKKQNLSLVTLAEYDKKIKDSVIYRDLKSTRHMRHVFKDGFFIGGAKAALLTVTGGLFPGYHGPFKSDAGETKKIMLEASATPPSSATQSPVKTLSKVDAVYLSGNKTRDDIPPHLTTVKNVPKKVAEFYSHLCPAGVYEVQGDNLVINAPNCVDCKATDVLGPAWQPREGGSGPKYKNM